MNQLIYEKVGKIGRIIINRPEARNALNSTVLQGLSEALDEAGKDDEVSVVVISGNGEKAFSAGFDLKENMGEDPVTDITARREDTHSEIDLFMKIWDLPKPVIAQIHGYCLGGGISIGMMSDMIIAGDNLKLGNPEMLLGYIPQMAISTYKMPFNKVRELYYLADYWDVEELHTLGLINKVFPYEKLEEETMKIAQKIARIPLDSLRMMKYSLNKNYEIQGIRNCNDFAAEMFSLNRLNMINKFDIGGSIKEKGLKETLDGIYKE